MLLYNKVSLEYYLYCGFDITFGGFSRASWE